MDTIYFVMEYQIYFEPSTYMAMSSLTYLIEQN
jgi:hypothetical protein